MGSSTSVPKPTEESEKAKKAKKDQKAAKKAAKEAKKQEHKEWVESRNELNRVRRLSPVDWEIEMSYNASRNLPPDDMPLAEQLKWMREQKEKESSSK